MNILLTGGVGGGKTTVCRKILSRLEQNSVKCGGVLGDNFTQDGVKSGIDALNIKSKKTSPLARLKKNSTVRGFDTQKYRISADGIEFVAKALEDALECDVIFVDEVGPLEMKKQGVINALEKVMEYGANKVVVARRKYVSKILKMFPDKGFMVFDVSKKNRDTLPEEITKLIENEVSR